MADDMDWSWQEINLEVLSAQKIFKFRPTQTLD